MKTRLNLSPQRALKTAQVSTKQAAARAGETLLKDSQRRAPVDQGTLRESAHLGVSEANGRIQARVSFDAEHAVYVHETHPAKRKFLENAVSDPALRQEILQDMQDALRF